jgi:hemolysin III
MQNPVRGFLHGSAALMSVAGVAALLTRSDDTTMTIATGIYGFALIGMYTVSALYHSIPWVPQWKARLQKADHALIYTLVAGTFTPLVIGAGQGWWVMVGLVSVWSLVGLGLGREMADGPRRRLWLRCQLLAGGIALIPLFLTLTAMDTPVAMLTLGGGVAYLFGVALFVNDRPRLSPGIFSHHEFFHVVVMAASSFHFLAVWMLLAAI